VGSAGSVGFTGSRGLQGFSGSVGFNGSVGFVGSVGFTGSAGFTGSQGISANQSLNTTNNVQFNSLGVNTAASGTAGEIRATGNITAYFSDDRLKTRLGSIENALDKIKTLEAFYYEPNEVAVGLGYEKVRDVGVSAQQVQSVLPEIVVPAPIDENYLTVRYEKLVPLLIQAMKDLIDMVEQNKKE